jgi:nicotinamide-nucleotide adenylyltransferase
MPFPNIGLFLGKFEPFHNAHYEVVRRSFLYVDHLVIGVGSSQYSRTKVCPFSYDERRKMIEGTVDNSYYNYNIIPIPDIHDPPNYVEHVKKLTCFFPFNTVITDNHNTIELFEKKGYNIVTLPVKTKIRGTDIRRLWREGSSTWEMYVPDSTRKIMKEVKNV